MPAQTAPTAIATRTMTSDVQRAGQRRPRRRPPRRRTPRAVLAVDADVEQVHPEADRHRERRQVVDRSRWLMMLTDDARLGVPQSRRSRRQNVDDRVAGRATSTSDW